jgi:putative transposase
MVARLVLDRALRSRVQAMKASAQPGEQLTIAAGEGQKVKNRFEGQERWLHKVRLYPTCDQTRTLFEMLKTTRDLYNALLQQRRDSWTTRKQSFPGKRQYAELTELRAEEPRFAKVYRECEDAVLHRLDLAMQAFFRRVKMGEEDAGYPRFKSARRWNQLEFQHGDRATKLDARQQRVRLPGVGDVKLRKGREVPAEYGRVFIVHKNGRWYAVFEAHREAVPAAMTGMSVGIDRGVRVLAALSDGTKIENIRPGSKRKAVVEKHAQSLDAVTVKDAIGHPTNHRDQARIAAVRRLARAKEREANARRDWLHKVSRKVVDAFDTIALEDLKLVNMTKSAKGTAEKPGKNVAQKSGLNRSILDAGFGILATLIREKAANAARTVVNVDPRYTSQTCADCGHVAKASRDGARFLCVGCGHADDADVNAARVILSRAESPPMRAPGRTRGAQQDAA